MAVVCGSRLPGSVPIRLTATVRECHDLDVARCSLNEEERAMPTAKQIRKFIRDTIAILVECLILARELVFTAAAFYGLYHALWLLIQ